ncbi:RNA-guided endonuclease InsQ/TnpB family protein [Virgibacillus oceani]|uniref:Transposase n=1 Tax=Virgibacillus oceani TaxID=1479511 RepID=A0A917HGC8_9BACI|nr:RNA-guided endonuclease TnpB family protein [Virgibacillus oceani]GGG78312.1 hypothetical protein GCM10011398_24440 [Virgibacillus oceani]
MAGYKTMQIWVKKGHRMYGYFEEMCQNAKNMHHTTNFYIRQVYTALTQEKALQPLQKEVLDNIRIHLPEINANQLAAYRKKVVKEEAIPSDKRKEVTCFLFEEPTKEKPYINYNVIDALFKSMSQNDYRSLPVQSSQWVMKVVFQNWKSFYASLREYRNTPSKFKARPKIPGYSRSKEKEVTFSNQDCVIRDHKFLKFPKTKERLNIGKLGWIEGKLKQVRVIPKYGQYVVGIIFAVPPAQESRESKNRYLSIDLGIDNLATIVTNTGERPVLVKGKTIKSINQRFNQLKSHYTGILRQGKNTSQGSFTSKRLEKINNKRFNQLKDLFHKASYQIEKLALENDIDTFIIGHNKGWKDHSNMGKRNNQTFITIPHRLLVQMITYKVERHGIKVIMTEESYTSQASFLDYDDIPVYGEEMNNSFSGKRVKRGLYRSKNGTHMNADVNGAANIMKKVFRDAFKEPFACTETLLYPISVTLK